MLSAVHRLRDRLPAWQWLAGLAFASGLIPVVMAITVRNRCSDADPACVFHRYTLLTLKGVWILGLVGAPALIGLAVASALHLKVTRRNIRAGQVAWGLAVLSWLICFVGLVIVGVVMLVPGALTTSAVAIAPLPPDPSDPLATPGGGYFGRRALERGMLADHDGPWMSRHR